MVFKRQLNGGSDDDQGSKFPTKRPHLISMLKGINYGGSMQEYMTCLEPMIRKMVREEVNTGINRYMRFVSPGSSYNRVECSGSRNLQLQIQTPLPKTLFTGSRILSEEKTPIKVVLYDSSTHGIITTGPLSSLKVTIVALDSDFGGDDREDWTMKEFGNKVVKNREGRRPLLTGELMINLQGGVGYMGEISFTDNSSWTRTGKFRLGVKASASCHEMSIREAMTNAFRVKDQRGESYKKSDPPSLDDDVWRLKKIAKDGPSHKRLNAFGIHNVGDFLRLLFKDQNQLRNLLKVSKKTWETIIEHAKQCSSDDKKYMYKTSQQGLLFNSVNSQGQDYHKSVVEEHKEHAYRNIKEWIPVCDPSTIDHGYPHMPMETQAADGFSNPNFTFQHEINMNQPTMSHTYTSGQMEQDNCSFELGESSNSGASFIPAFRDSFVMNFTELDHHHHQTWPSTTNYMGLVSGLSTDDLPIDDNFQVESSAWHGNGNGLFVDHHMNHDFGIISSNSGIRIPRNRLPKTRWCKVLSVVKWRILAKRNVAARKWNPLEASFF